MAVEKIDTVILGGGNAAMGVTVATREAGMSVALIEDRDLGGTCPNRGCTPKKVLVAAAHTLDEIARAKIHCIEVGSPRLDWTALIAREKAMIKPIPERLGKAMADRGVQVIRGHARFAAPNAIEIGDRLLEAKNIVIATGSKPRTLPIAGADHMITSDDVLSDPTLPKSVVFIGGGVIALEFSHVYIRAGVKVTILETLPRLLAAMDADAVDRIHRESERLGIAIHTGVKVHRIQPSGDGYRVVFEQGGSERTIDAERVVNGAGRVANVDAIDLDSGQVRHEDFRLALDPTLRSVSNSAVHACGDVLWNAPQLSPVATYEGRIVGRNIVEGPHHRPDYSSIPACVYTIPVLASVGLTEAKAREAGLKIKVQATDMAEWISARTYAESAAWAKVVVDEASDRILGAHIVGHGGEELINIFALAIRHGITAAALRDQVYGYPTFAADIKYLL